MFWNFLAKFRKPTERIYLDHAAATPVREEVLVAMAPYFRDHYGNPSAIHQEGTRARDAIEEARTKIARTLHVRPDDIIFTGSGTESNNLAIYGLLKETAETNNTRYEDIEVISTKIEHPSILRVLEELASHGVVVHFVELNKHGEIDQKQFASLLSKKTALVTFAYANSEIGVVQDVKRLMRTVRKFNTTHKTAIKTHLDASQAPLWLSCDIDMLGVDMMTLDSGKCYGPKGVGVLAVRHSVRLKTVTLGGEQEFGLRGGTENTPLIVGCAEAILRAQEGWEVRRGKTTVLRDRMIAALLHSIPGSVLNGSHENRIANNVNISISGIDSEFAIVVLDRRGIAASTQSACSGASAAGSSVIREITGDEARARSTIRFTLGEETTGAELMKTVTCLEKHVEKMKVLQKSR